MSCNHECHHECHNEKMPGREIRINGCECQVEANLMVNSPQMVRICGRVFNQCRKPADGVWVCLVKVQKGDCGKHSMKKVCETRTDCDGRYEFNVESCGCGEKYRVIAKGDCDGECEKEDCGCRKHHMNECGCGCGC